MNGIMEIQVTAADVRAAETAAMQEGVTLESITARLVAAGYTPEGIQNNAPEMLRKWIATHARNAAIMRHRTTLAAPRERMGCSGCGDHVPARRRGAEWLCCACRGAP